MKGNGRENKGLKILRDRYRKAFRVPKNLNYYPNDEDLNKAERGIIRDDLLQRRVPFFFPVSVSVKRLLKKRPPRGTAL